MLLFSSIIFVLYLTLNIRKIKQGWDLKMVEQERIQLIDLHDLGISLRTGCYVLLEEHLTIIETGPSPSVTYIREGLTKLGYSLEDLKYIIVTHIHLDHSGGVGLLLRECPNAKVIVHERGARHLIDPKRLAASARGVYGDQFQELFEPIIPVPEDRIIIKKEGEELKIGEECTLQFWDTPGHANHHLAIYDPVSHGLFTGDTTGVRYAELANEGIEFYLPSTSPNQFNPSIMLDTFRRMKALNLDVLYFGHYGFTTNVKEVFQQVEMWLPIFVDEAKEVYRIGGNYGMLRDRLFEEVQAYLQTKGIADTHSVYGMIQLDMTVCSMGLMEYVMKSESKPELIGKNRETDR